MNFDVTEHMNLIVSISKSIAFAIVIFVVGRWITRKIVDFATKVMERSKVDDTIANFLGNVLYGFLLIILMMIVLSTLGVDSSSMITILGAAAVAIGFSLKDQLSNFAAGVLIVVFRPFSRGDFVDIKGLQGTVRDISLMNTRLITLNNHEVIIPNSEVTSNATTNFTSLQNRRVDLTISISYNADIKVAKDVILTVATNHDAVFSDPAPEVNVVGLGDNSVNIELRSWTANQSWLQVRSDILEEIKYALDRHNIEIPLPQRAVHLIKEEDNFN